jgi:hypothetical protein
MSQSYRFQSTSADLLDAEAVSRSLTSPRPPFRWALVVLAVLWLAAGVSGLRTRAGAGSLVPLCLGAVVIYQHVLAPQLKRRRMVKDNPLPEEVILTFGEDAIEVEVVGEGRRFVRRWDELVSFVERRHGILFSFSDRTSSWLPKRVFANAADQAALVSFLRGQQSIHSFKPLN